MGDSWEEAFRDADEQSGKSQSVSMRLVTGVVTQSTLPHLYRGSNIIYTQIRFEEQPQASNLVWFRSEDPGILIRDDFKFIRDKLFKSKLLHIEVSGFQTGTRASSFDLTGLREEYAKHKECKQQ
jgi:hypothetical protein